MSAILTLYANQFLIFVLVFSRVSGLVMTAPIFGSRSIPVRIRAFIALALALLITPVYWDTPLEEPGNLLNLLVYVGQEVVLGMTLGLGILILFMGLQVAGQIVAQMSALSLADLFDPNFDGNVSVFSHLFEVIALAVFLIIGGHRQVLEALLETFRTIPPGDATYAPGLTSALVEVVTQSFLLGVRAASPAIVSLLMSILVLGIVSRTLPQLNILAVGFSVNTIVLMGTLGLSLGAMVWTFREHLDPTVQMLVRVLQGGLFPAA